MMETSVDSEGKKLPVDDLSKEEILKKYTSLRALLQKAKIAKDALTDENNSLKQQLNNEGTQEIIARLTEQKVNLSSELEECKLKVKYLEDKLNDSQQQCAKVVVLDTENEGYKRQVNRLVEENEELIATLNNFERELAELKSVHVEQSPHSLGRNEAQIDDDPTINRVQYEELNGKIDILQAEKASLILGNEALANQVLDNAAIIKNLKVLVDDKGKTIESYISSTDDLNTELHKNRALVEKLKQDVATMSAKLSDNQIVSSGVASDLENVNGRLKNKIRTYHQKIVKFAGDVKSLKQSRLEVLDSVKIYVEQVNLWREQLKVFHQQLERTVNECNKEKAGLINSNAEYKSNCAKLRDECEVLEKERGKIVEDKELLAGKNHELQAALQLKNEQFNLLQIELENGRNRPTTEQFAQTEETYDDLQKTLANVKRENADLLSEMNEMNQMLKERGEAIFKQQEHGEELVKTLKTYEQQANNYHSLLKEKEDVISQLECKTNSDITHQSANETDLQKLLNEKDEELAHLRSEIIGMKEKLNFSHDSYADSEMMSTSTISRTEEASRLKDIDASWEERYGKLRSLALKLKAKVRDLTVDLAKEQAEKTECQQQLADALQSLQKQCDDEQLKALLHEVSKCKKQLADNEEVLAKQRRDLEQLHNEKQTTIEWKKQVGVKVQNLRKELEANALIKRDFEEQIARLRAQLEAKDQQLQELEVRANLHASTQQSVLNLEMQDYERGVHELKQKLERKNALIDKLKNQMDGERSATTKNMEAKRLADERCQLFETDLNNCRAEIARHQKHIVDLETSITNKEEHVYKMTRDLEVARAETEDLSTQLSQLIAEQQKSVDALKGEREYLRASNLGLEEKVRELQQRLNAQAELVTKTAHEYETYRVRAQSVLKQNHGRDVGVEEKLAEQAASLDAQVQILLGQIEESKSVAEKYKSENHLLANVNSELKQQCENGVKELQEQRALLQELTVKHQRALGEHNEAVRILKVHSETLAQCFRQQLSEQEARHNHEIIALQSKIDSSTSAHSEMQAFRAQAHSRPAVREEGEGSENVENGAPVQPTPLERLLTSEGDHEFGFIRRQLGENEKKVQHLTALLADTEQDLAKHVQMNKLLKEEIRRQQRSVEREQHAENLEYLKNVVFKFVTLANGDERTRLVPVLNTILKFSPDEMQKLNAVARGELLKGWSNFLPPLWSSPK